MSFSQVLDEVARLTPEERQQLIRRVLEIEDRPLTSEEEALVDARLAAHRRSPETSIPLDEMKARLRRDWQ